jgi:TolB-like protein/DNA-binding CsgD family transcriptional regulator
VGNSAETASPTSPAALGLSARQAEVLALMMQGKSNKAICRVLTLAEPTVKYHVATILKALKVSNRTEAVLAVGTLGWKLPPVADVDRGTHAGPAKARRPNPSLPDKPSIVVMPFANLSGDSAQDYFSDGMAEDITIALGRLPWLFVIGSASAFTYKNRAIDLRQIGSELGVRYLLMGSVRKEGSRVRITVQLIDNAHGGQIWADRFEGELDSIFAMQDQVASHVSATIAPALRSEEIERVRHKPTENLTAYDLFLRALPLHRESFAKNQEALSLLHKAIDLDPSYGAAYGLAAVCHFWQKMYGWVSPFDPSLMEGVRLAHIAAKIGANDSEALWMVGQIFTTITAELEVARGLSERATTLNPNSSNAWAVSAIANSYLGNHEIAFDHIARARRLNPLEFPFVNYWATVAHLHFVLGQYEEVLRTSEKALAENPKALPALRMRVAACGLLGRIEEGRDAVALLLAEVPATTVASLKAHYWAIWQHHPRRRDDFLTGLRRSGLPEG